MVALDPTYGILAREKRVMTERKAEDWISGWKGMNDEFIEEDTMFRLDIPSTEKTQEWMNQEKPLLKVNHSKYYFDD
jgi:hypothetical protein